MPSLVFWDTKLYTLEDAVIGGKLKEMSNGIHGSNYSATLDCVDAAQTAGEVAGIFLGLALKNGDEYIDITEEEGNNLLFDTNFDCPSELFEHRDSDEIVKIYKSGEE